MGFAKVDERVAQGAEASPTRVKLIRSEKRFVHVEKALYFPPLRPHFFIIEIV
jgi:hypothetical protein